MTSDSDLSFTFEKSLKDSFEIFDSFYVTNDIEGAITRLDKLAQYDLNYSANRAILAILKSTFTLDPKDLERATKYSTQTVQLCDKIRRTGILHSVLRYIRKPDYNQYSENEVFAELIFGIIMGYSGALGLSNCRSMFDFLRLINRFRLSKNAFQECKKIFKSRTQWESDSVRNNFEACLRMERGCRHLIISSLPPKILKLVNFFGYRGTHKVAFNELTSVTFDYDTVYSRGAETVLLIYYLYVCPVFATNIKRLSVAERILKKCLKRRPNFILYHMLNAKYKYLSSDQTLDKSIKCFEKTLTLNRHIQTFNAIPYFDLICCYALKCDWSQAIKYSKLLRQKALHSPTIFTYFEAVFRYTKSVETNDKKCRQEANRLFKSVPQLPILFWGMKLAFEMIAIDNSKKYFDNNEFLLLPVIELLYIWNNFVVMKGKNDVLIKFLHIVEKEMKKLDKQQDKLKYYTTYFYKGVIIMNMEKLDEAKTIFEEILKEKDRLNSSLIAQTFTELGFIEILMNDNRKNAKDLWDKAINDYSGYLMDMALHTRIYSALREFDISSDESDDSFSCSEDSISVVSDVDDLGDQFVDGRLELMRM